MLQSLALARWPGLIAAVALMTLPLVGSAQTPAQLGTKVDAAAAKEHLTAARDTLSQLTAMPEAARLQGDARTQVSQIISDFNALISTQSDWRSAYAKVDAGLAALLGPESPDATPAPGGMTGAVGTSGSSAAAQLDPAVRGKLVEFRAHLKGFERAAGGTATGTMAPSVATGSTANPAPPSSGAAPAPAAAAMVPADQAKVAEQVTRAESDKHLDAMSAILARAQTSPLTKAQMAELKKHVAELRALLKK